MYKNTDKENLDEIKSLVEITSNRINNLVSYYMIHKLSKSRLQEQRDVINRYISLLDEISKVSKFDKGYSNSIESFLDSITNFRKYLDLYIENRNNSFLESLNNQLLDSVIVTSSLRKEPDLKGLDIKIDELPF